MRKRVTSLILAAVAGCSCFAVVGCGGRGGEKIDKSKTQLNLGLTINASGREWLDAIGDAFEEKYKDVSFEDDKKGVQVMLERGKDEYTGKILTSNMSVSGIDVYFTELVAYTDLLASKAAMDITDIITEKYDTVDFGDGAKEHSILDKMGEDDKGYLVRNDGTEHYYAVPWFKPLHGIVYDVDLFNSKNLYFLANGQIGGSLDKNAAALSNGPDNQKGTYDDGLPATWEQFKALMSHMRNNGVIPFIWDGDNMYQRNYFFESVWMSYEGYDNYKLNYTFDGNYTVDGTVTAITKENGYLIANQEGKKATLQVISDIVSNKKNYSDQSFLTSHGNLGTQGEFLLSNSPKKNKPIAMLIEGSYWENESAGNFDAMVASDGAAWGKGARRFGYMTIPKFIGTSGIRNQTNTETVLNTQNNSLIVANAYSKKTNLIKEFLQFLLSNENLIKYSTMTGISSACKYVVEDESVLDGLTYYQKQTLSILNDHSNKFVNKNFINAYATEYADYLKYWSKDLNVNGMVYNDIFKNISDSYIAGNPLSVSDLFASYTKNYTQSTWSANFSK